MVGRRIGGDGKSEKQPHAQRRIGDFETFMTGDQAPPPQSMPLPQAPQWVSRLRRQPPRGFARREVPSEQLPIDLERDFVYGPGAVTGEPSPPWDAPPMDAVPLSDVALQGDVYAPDMRDGPPQPAPPSRGFSPPSATNMPSEDDLDAAWAAARARVRANPQYDPTGLRRARNAYVADETSRIQQEDQMRRLTGPLRR